MYKIIYHDYYGSVIDAQSRTDYEPIHENDVVISSIDINDEEWSKPNIAWILERLVWCRDNDLYIGELAYQDYVHKIKKYYNNRVYKFKFWYEEDATAYK